MGSGEATVASGQSAADVRRRVLRGALGSLALAATTVISLDAPRAASAAAASKHDCHHWHRCARHRRHTCRGKHTCRHRHHGRRRKSRTRNRPAAPPGSTPAPEPAPGTPSELAPVLTPVPEIPENPSPPPPVAPVPDPTFEEFPDSEVPAPGLELPADVRRVLSRFTYGYTRELHAQVHAAGSLRDWFEDQLEPGGITDDAADQLRAWWPSLDRSPSQLWSHHVNGTATVWEALQNYGRWCLLRRIRSTRQVHEVISEFWEDHLHIPLYDDSVFLHRAHYGFTIREHALGRYADLLKATILHPAMSLSLDNATSTRSAPNENLGRELLELHTVGSGNFTEADVKASARILTGYRVDAWGTWRDWYDPGSHWIGPVSVLGFTHANANPDGRQVASGYLDHLARHPRTALRLAHKLAVRFVSDEPPARLVEHLAAIYLANDTDIRPVLRALMRSADLHTAPPKVSTPLHDLAATYRALQVAVDPPKSERSGANSMLWYAAALGQMPFEWPRPDGPPADDDAWSSTSRFLSADSFHRTTAGGWWPNEDITYRSYASWLPAETGSLSALIDHVSLLLFGHPSNDRVKRACVEACGGRLTDLVTARHDLATWRMPELLAVLLASPEHLLR